MIADGFPASAVVTQLHNVLLEEEWGLTDSKLGSIVMAMADTDRCLKQGGDEYLQLLILCSQVMAAWHPPIQY